MPDNYGFSKLSLREMQALRLYLLIEIGHAADDVRILELEKWISFARRNH